MFVTVVIRALSRLPSRTARVRLELVPRAVVVAVALAQDARRASAGDGSRDPGVPVSVVGWSHLVPVPARGGVARRRGRVPRVWVPRVAVELQAGRLSFCIKEVAGLGAHLTTTVDGVELDPYRSQWTPEDVGGCSGVLNWE